MLKKLFKNSAYSRKTIVRDLLLWLVLLVFVTAATAAAGHLYYSHFKMADEINKRGGSLVADLSSLLSIPLYNMDRDGVVHICEIYSKMPDLVSICVENDRGDKIFEVNCHESKPFSRSVDIAWQEHEVGRLTIALADDIHKKHRNHTLTLIFLMGFALMVAMVVGIHTIMHYMLGRPLQQFNRGLSEIAGGSYSTRLKRVVHDDLNGSVEAVNSMANQIEKVISNQRLTGEFLQNVLNSMDSIMIGVDGDCCISHMNLSAERSAEKEGRECYGQMIADIFPCLKGDPVALIKQAMSEGIPVTMEQKESPIFSELEKAYVEITIFPLHKSSSGGAVVRVDEITSRVRLQEVMAQTEKMISIGGLGAGMAHEINNPLAAILQAAQNVERRLSPEIEKNREVAQQLGLDFQAMENYLDERQVFVMLSGIRDAGQRAARIVQNMLKFSRHSDSTLKQSCQLAPIIDRALELVDNDYDLKRKYDFKNVTIIKNFSAAIEAFCNRTEIEQVFLNIFKNAAHAFGTTRREGSPSPEITINMYDDEAFVSVEVADNGPGMEEEAKKRIFEPFFTTKEVGEGAGLGMAVAYFIIVDQHQGCLSVESTPGRGTTILLKLPKRTSDTAS